MAINFPDSPTSGDTHTVGDKTWTWNGTSWDVVVSTPISNQIIDADGDTRIQVEESPDEDYIRFDTAGTERMTIGPTGDVTVANDLSVTGTISGGSTSFPTSLDSGTMPAIEALQAKVGADSSAVTSSLDYKVAQLEADVAGFTSGKILQVVNATHSTQVLVSSTTYAATGLTASITPSATSSKVFVIITNPMYAWNENNLTTDSGGGLSKLYRDGSEIHDFYQFGYNDNASVQRFMRFNGTLTYMDSPSTTSSVSYEQYIASYGTSYSTYSCYNNNTASITLLEVGA